MARKASMLRHEEGHFYEVFVVTGSNRIARITTASREPTQAARMAQNVVGSRQGNAWTGGGPVI
jgi:hypothetical protein